VRYLLISDLHGNYEALAAVLDHARGHYDRIVCCGDLVGYGPDPNRIVEWARANLFAVIRGNHDRACCGIDDLEWFNPIAQAASRWTMAELTPENTAWLRTLPRGPIAVNGFTIAHGSPLDEDEYISSLTDADNLYDYLESSVTFIGHTHLQGGFAWSEGNRSAIARPKSSESVVGFRLDPDGIYLINPGSTGQPRDADPRAAYAIFHSEERAVTLHRVAYDFDAVRQKIENSGLPPALGWRLAFGK
jgi:diadenosine tetraphosphatase ApaH/serine/threonine PP2A family protein phosphatase